MTSLRDYANIPSAIVKGLTNYTTHGQPVGDFLQAVIANDFLDAVGRADEKSMRGLPAIACYVYQELPSTCHGSRAVYKAWLTFHDGKRQGLDGAELQVLADAVTAARQKAVEARGR